MSPTYTGRRRRLTDAEVVARYQELRDSYTVGLEAGLDAAKVLEIVRAAGVEVNRPNQRATRKRFKLTAEQMAERYRAGDTGEQIAHAAGCSTRTVYDALESLGVPRRPATIGLMRGKRRGLSTEG